MRTILLLFLLGIGPTTVTKAQIDTMYIPGRMYVIRLSDLYGSPDSLEQHWPSLVRGMEQGNGLLQHIKAHLIKAQEAATGHWFMGYCDPRRQGRDELMRDVDLVKWYYRGDQGMVYPIETLVSPDRREPPTEPWNNKLEMRPRPPDP